MLTKSDFQKAIADSITNYPDIAALYQAGDPRIIQNLDAMAAMLAMFSSQLETAMAEPFEKVRDGTVLADAALRGVIRKASPGRVRLSVKNNNPTAFTVDTGRTIIDSTGLPYIIETTAIIAAGATGTVDAIQLRREVVNHTVSGSVPFYPIEIPAATDDSHLSGISVSDSGGEYVYRERYTNTWPGERVFHVEADDRQSIYVRFGQTDIVGVQPANGKVIKLTISRTMGEISPTAGSPFSFEYLNSPKELLVNITMNTLLEKGQNPPGMTVLRDLVKYPSVYNHNAVFLGEFDFVVRRAYSNTKFLSVWNESTEEIIRGANVDNINTLFVACVSADGTESFLEEPNPQSPVTPTFIAEGNLTVTQKGIRSVILSADDSYRVKFMTPVRSKIPMTITATISAAYVASDVRSKIIETILAEYGETQPGSRRGTVKPLYKRVYSLLREKIPALSDANADITVSITEYEGEYRPELWRFVSTDSLTVTVTAVNVLPPAWGN